MQISASERRHDASTDSVGRAARERVVVVGLTTLGYAFAKFLRLWGGGNIDVTLVGSARKPPEPTPSSPADADELAQNCRRHDIHLHPAAVTSIDARIHLVSLQDGSHLPYDRLVIAPDDSAGIHAETLPR